MRKGQFYGRFLQARARDRLPMTHRPDDLQRIADRYAAFAANEAHGVSEIYERLALATAASPELLAFLASLPANRRRPNLFLATVRHLWGVPEDADRLIAAVRRDGDRIRSTMLSRTTQTNEPARCSALLPLLAKLPEPLALLEVGASAGLCLLPDRYGYDYGRKRIEPGVAAEPVFRCDVNDAAPLPAKVPRVVWRLGLDVHPVDLRSEDEVGWLETLIWPRKHGATGSQRECERRTPAGSATKLQPSSRPMREQHRPRQGAANFS
jgi:hypothetical protein